MGIQIRGNRFSPGCQVQFVYATIGEITGVDFELIPLAMTVLESAVGIPLKGQHTDQLSRIIGRCPSIGSSPQGHLGDFRLALRKTR